MTTFMILNALAVTLGGANLLFDGDYMSKLEYRVTWFFQVLCGSFLVMGLMQ